MTEPNFHTLPDPTSHTFGDELSAWRYDNAMTQTALAAVLGVHPMTVSKWERDTNRTAPDEDSVARLSALRSGGPEAVRDTAERFAIERARKNFA